MLHYKSYRFLNKGRKILPTASHVGIKHSTNLPMFNFCKWKDGRMFWGSASCLTRCHKNASTCDSCSFTSQIIF